MLRSVGIAALAWLSVITPAALAAQDQPPPSITAVRITGARELSSQQIQEFARVKAGAPLVDTPEHVADLVARQYRDEGYTFARVKAAFDASSGVFSLDIDEGAIDAVVFQGVDEKLAQTFADEFALRAGDVFNRRRAREALDVLLRPTRGSVRPGRTSPQTFTDSRDLRRGGGVFDLVDRDGQRVLLVGLKEPPGRFRLVPDLGEREDWFSAVDGFVPSLGMGIAVFDHNQFNHTFVAGHLSYKFASEDVGYALGFERPLFGERKLYVGGELHELTASDDRWQASSLEASLSALGPARNIRDYYLRRGVQINGAFRFLPNMEALVAWRGERQEPLRINTDFSFWNGDD